MSNFGEILERSHQRLTNMIFILYSVGCMKAWRHKALEYIGRADKISANCPQTWLVKALFWIGEHHRDEHALRNAAYYADSSLRAGDESCVANLAKAAILFHEKKYANAMQLYVNALRLDPKAAGAAARQCCLLYKALGDAAGSPELWKLKPKFHLFVELAEYQAVIIIKYVGPIVIIEK